MTINLFDRKIHSLIGFFIIILGILFTIFLVKSGAIFEIGAGPGQNPKNVQVTNVTDISFTLSYTTDDKVIGTLKYGMDMNNLDKIVLDDRDQLSQTVNKYKFHSITVKNLDPKTTYYFNIISGDEEFLNNGKLWEIQTGKIIEEPPTFQKPLSGSVITFSGQIPEEGLVFVTINGAGKLSTLLRDNGTYTIPLNNLRNESLDKFFKVDGNMKINIEVEAGNSLKSLSVSPDQTSPVPPITISSNPNSSSDEIPSIEPKLPDEEKILPPQQPSPPANSSSGIITALTKAISAVTGIFSSR